MVRSSIYFMYSFILTRLWLLYIICHTFVTELLWPKCLGCLCHRRRTIYFLGFSVQFSCINLLPMCLYRLRSPCNFFPWLTIQTLQRPCGNRRETPQSSCYLYDLRKEITRCPCDVLAGFLQLSQEPKIFYGRKLQSKIWCCPHDQRAMLLGDHMIYLQCV